MTGYDIFKRVLSLLGQSETRDYSDPQRNEAVKDILNQIFTDLKLEEITDLSQKIRLEKKALDTVIYGCCWLYAVTVRDKGCADLYCRAYSAKRTALLGNSDTRSDVLPTAFGGA